VHQRLGLIAAVDDVLALPLRIGAIGERLGRLRVAHHIRIPGDAAHLRDGGDVIAFRIHSRGVNFRPALRQGFVHRLVIVLRFHEEAGFPVLLLEFAGDVEHLVRRKLVLLNRDEVALERRDAGLALVFRLDVREFFFQRLEHRLGVADGPVEADAEFAAELGHLSLGVRKKLFVRRGCANIRREGEGQDTYDGGSEPRDVLPHE
jgi:hypothetical protein